MLAVDTVLLERIWGMSCNWLRLGATSYEVHDMITIQQYHKLSFIR